MFRRTFFTFSKDPIFFKVITLCLILFFVYLADAILSFWAPTFIEESLKSPFLMGIIISFSSVVGLGADVILPQILKGISVKKLLFLAVISSFLFAITLLSSTFRPYVAIFLLAMAIWGIYYEFLGFANQQFAADSIPLRSHSSAWAMISVFKNLAYFLGPILAGWLLSVNNELVIAGAIFFLLVGFVVFLSSGRSHSRPVEIDVSEVNLTREIEHWFVLFKKVWPVVLMGLFMGLIDATFWTTGAVWTAKLREQSFFGGLFLSFYTLPSLFMGFVVAKWGVVSGKKRIATVCLFATGSLLFIMGLNAAVWWQLLFVVAAATSQAVSYPMVDAVYSDIVSRMGRERRHLIGLSNSTISVAYILGPALAGFIAEGVGEKATFMVIGVITALVSLVLFVIIPKKLKLPQKEIKRWD